MRTFGQTTAFVERSWEELHGVWAEKSLSGLPVAHLVAIIESVIESGATDRIAAASAMYDLIVTERPIVAPPYPVVFVRSPMSISPPGPGMVVMEHSSLAGRVDRIERPTAESVPLFWRFMIEKLGVEPPNRRTDQESRSRREGW